MFERKKILITGGCGFIAGHLAARLTDFGADVRLFDIQPPPPTSGYEFVSGNVLDYNSLERATRGCDMVFHFAAILGVEKILNDPLGVMDVNMRGTINALKAAGANDVGRFVYSSSSEIYGDLSYGGPAREDMAPAPVSTYGVSKLAAETYCNAYARVTGLSVTRLRFFNVYGPGQANEFVVPRFVSRVLAGESPVIYGRGDQVRSYTYIDDAVKGILAAASYSVGDVFNIGRPEPVTVADLARLIIDISGTRLEPIYQAFGEGIRSAQREIYTRVPDVSKAKKILDFEARISAREGVEAYYNHCLQVRDGILRRSLT